MTRPRKRGAGPETARPPEAPAEPGQAEVPQGGEIGDEDALRVETAAPPIVSEGGLSLEQELRRAQEALASAEEERDRAREQLLRVAADFDNARKRLARDVDEAKRFANEEMIKTLLPVLDNLERALVHGGNEGAAAALCEGVRLTLAQFVGALEKFGVVVIDPGGEPFDPALHEAVEQVVAGDAVVPGTVVGVHRKGYRLHDRLLRPALVTVAVEAPLEPEATGDASASAHR